MTNTEQNDDKFLLVAAGRGDTDAVNQIVIRHQAMVYATCLRILGNPADAEDAAQATFLLFVKKCRRIRRDVVLGGWLYLVAGLVSRQHIRAAARRRKREEEAHAMEYFTPEESDRTWEELRPVIDTTLMSLPARYRDPLILRYLEGRTTAETAETMGISESLVTTRLARAREKLRSLFVRKGITVSAVLLPMILAEKAAAVTVPATLQATILDSVQNFVVGGMATAAISAKVSLMMKGGLVKMFWTKIKMSTATAALAVLVIGAGAKLMSKELALTLDLTDEQAQQVEQVFNTFHSKYLAVEKQHTQILHDESNLVALAISPFPDEVKELKEQLWRQLDLILDARQKAVARGHISEEMIFPYGMEQFDLEISHDGKEFNHKMCYGSNTSNGSGTSLDEALGRFWNENKTRSQIPTTDWRLGRLSSRSIMLGSKSCIDFKSDKPELTADFVQVLNLTPEQCKKVNTIILAAFKEYVVEESKHVKSGADAGSIQLTVSPFKAELEGIQKRMRSALGDVLDSRQVTLAEGLYEPISHGTGDVLFPYGSMTYNIAIKHGTNDMYDIKCSGKGGLNSSNASKSCRKDELPESYRRLLVKQTDDQM